MTEFRVQRGPPTKNPWFPSSKWQILDDFGGIGALKILVPQMYDMILKPQADMGGSRVMGDPQNGWFLMEGPIKMNDLRVPLLQEPLIWLTIINHYYPL